MRRTGIILILVVIVIIIGALLIMQGEFFTQNDVADSPLNERIESSSFRPIEDIINAELVVTGFASDGTATLPIETSIPVACTVVYGTTTEFGELSLDQDMEGGSHSSHNPLLRNLEPDTEYFFRVQGVDDFGNIYLSDIMQFRTPASIEATNPTNLLSPEMGAEIIGYSSAFGGAEPDANWGIGSAFDGNPNTAWSSAGDGDDAWVEVRLAQRSRIHRVEFWTRSMSNDTAQIFEFTVTTDNGEVFGPFEPEDAGQAYEFEVEIEAETLRFDVLRSNGGNTGAVEIAAYGEPIEE